ncbi:hypothetical protein HC891_04400 [Candidatus Gracilibacteria bacterium]|nr:hypothetical protein [Candidatus Gracilibacteria bacterium]
MFWGIVNDFVALAAGISSKPAPDSLSLREGAGDAAAQLCVIGAGLALLPLLALGWQRTIFLAARRA